MPRVRYKVEEIQMPANLSRGGRQLWGIYKTELVARLDNVMVADRIAKLLTEDEANNDGSTGN